MKEQLEAKKEQKNTVHDPNREPMTLSTLWQLWIDNLKSWRQYQEEHPDLFTLNLQAGVKRFFAWLGRVRGSARHLVDENRHSSFPESEHSAAQLFLFFWNSLPRLGANLRERISRRRKRLIRAGDRRRSHFEQMKLHPVAFLAGAMAIAAAATILSLYTIGARAVYDGTDLGVVSSQHAVELAVAEVEGITRETLHDSSYQLDQSLLETETGVYLRKEVTSAENLRQELTEEIGLVEYANVLYVDGEKVVATTFPGALEDILTQLKLGYQTEDTVDAYFVEDVEIRQEYVDTSYVMNLGYIAEILNETKEGEVTYTVKSGDSYYSIADEYGLSVDALMKLNPGYDPKILRVGDVLTISNAVPYLTVVNVERQRYVQDVPYPVAYTDDGSMYQGEYKVISAGVYGKADVTANVTYINGTETERQIVASVTLSQPVTEQQLRGTKERPSWYPTGSFGWPCSGVITSYFGARNTGIRGASTYHEAIDIANSYGTPIYASDGGTVIYSGWLGGYGYLVKIDHGNGFITYYGHNSSLLVSVGQHVHKGQQIARMGSTGISSGNHCDFRIQLNGTFLNPLNYL